MCMQIINNTIRKNKRKENRINKTIQFINKLQLLFYTKSTYFYTLENLKRRKNKIEFLFFISI
jgi:hypothetical protein